MALNDEVPDGSSVALDTNVLIYYVEESPAYLRVVEPIIERVIAQRLEAHASVITLTELLIQPERLGRKEVAEQYRELPTLGLHLHDLDARLADEAAVLGGKYGLTTPDAIVCSTALRAGCAFILTNDPAFKRVEGIRVLVIDEYV